MKNERKLEELYSRIEEITTTHQDNLLMILKSLFTIIYENFAHY